MILFMRGRANSHPFNLREFTANNEVQRRAAESQNKGRQFNPPQPAIHQIPFVPLQTLTSIQVGLLK